MQTVLSKTGIEVCYPCTVHLLHNGENFECEYKSDHTGRDLLNYICEIQHIKDVNFWGLKFMDTSCMDEQRYWLDLDKLIRPQVKNISPIRFYFRVKVYPPEPYKIAQYSIRYPIYQQLRLDLLGGRLFCDVHDAGMLVALALQHVHGNFVHNLVWMYIAYMKSKILRKERCTPQFFVSCQKRALEIHQKLLVDLNKLEVEDMFLRLASKLDSYGVEPFLVHNIDKREVVLWINYAGLRVFNRKKKILHLRWNNISKITHEGRVLFVHMTLGGVMVFECVNYSECNYIWSVAVEHFIYFTSITYVSTSVGQDVRFFSNQDQRSESSSFFGSCITHYKYTRFEADMLEEDLKVAPSFMRLIDLNSWKSQLSMIYAVLLLYVMGSQTTIFDELPGVYCIRNFVKTFLSKFVFNKMLTF